MPNNFVDKRVKDMLNAAIYADGGQYDKSTKDLSFNTIKHCDERLHPKEQVYGLDLDGKSIAFTKEHLLANDNVITETINGEVITIKYFEEYDFVNMYIGNHPDVDVH